MATCTLYIVADENHYRLGNPPVVLLREPGWISRAWIARMVVELPEGFEVKETVYSDLGIFCGGEYYALGINADENPVIIDHNQYGTYIPLKILSKGWNEI